MRDWRELPRRRCKIITIPLPLTMRNAPPSRPPRSVVRREPIVSPRFLIHGHLRPRSDDNRGDLTVFVHPNTGQDLEDHRDRAIWLGQQVPLVLDIFTKRKDS